MHAVTKLFLVICALLIHGALTAPSSTGQQQVPTSQRQPQSLKWNQLLFDPDTLNDTMNAKNPRVGCTKGKVDQNELDQALTCFGDWCAAGNKIPPDNGEFCSVGSSMIYACNYGGWNPCYINELVAAWAAIQRDCGVGNGGWWFNPSWAKTYGVDAAGANICANLQQG
ncbi:hypothetical protein QBC43DRAFT_339751 [Cladorrhinum sp. PSN259]|nr:hypothetical protein QBC43DRAFT_339751 [Cladorrhinum sp. PSN259]